MPSFATLDDTALLVAISTPYMRSGLAYEKWEQYYGKDNDDDVLVVTLLPPEASGWPSGATPKPPFCPPN